MRGQCQEENRLAAVANEHLKKDNKKAILEEHEEIGFSGAAKLDTSRTRTRGQQQQDEQNNLPTPNWPTNECPLLCAAVTCAAWQ